MARTFLTPIDMSSLQILNFCVHNLASSDSLPTAEPGRLVLHDNQLKYGYTNASGVKQWATLLDSVNFNVGAYKTWAETSAYLTANYYNKTNVDNLLSGKANSTHSHTVSNITDWAAQWDSRFNTSSVVSTKFANYDTSSEVDAKILATDTKHTRVYANPTVVSIPLSQETANSSTTPGGTICFNTTTNHILYRVGMVYYSGMFPDAERLGENRGAMEGDLVILEPATVGESSVTATEIYVCKGLNNFVKVTDQAQIDAIRAEISALETSIGNTYAKKTDVYTKTDIDTKLNGYTTNSAFNSYKTSTDSSISALNSWKTTADGKISALETWKTAAAKTLEILTGNSDSDGTINKWKEVEAFLAGFSDSESQSLKDQLDGKASIGPKKSTGGFGSAITGTPTIGSLATSARSSKTYMRLSVDAGGNLAYEPAKYIFDFTVSSSNTSTYAQFTGTAFANFFGETVNTWQEMTVQVYKKSGTSYNMVTLDVRHDTAGVVLTWGAAPKGGEYRVIVTR